MTQNKISTEGLKFDSGRGISDLIFDGSDILEPSTPYWDVELY